MSISRSTSMPRYNGHARKSMRNLRGNSLFNSLHPRRKRCGRRPKGYKPGSKSMLLWRKALGARTRRVGMTASPRCANGIWRKMVEPGACHLKPNSISQAYVLALTYDSPSSVRKMSDTGKLQKGVVSLRTKFKVSKLTNCEQCQA